MTLWQHVSAAFLTPKLFLTFIYRSSAPVENWSYLVAFTPNSLRVLFIFFVSERGINQQSKMTAHSLRSAHERVQSALSRTTLVWSPLVYLVLAFVIMSVSTAITTKGLLKNTLHLHEKMSTEHYLVVMEIFSAMCALLGLGLATWHKDGKPFAKTAFVTDVPHLAFFWKGIVVCGFRRDYTSAFFPISFESV